MEQASRRYAFWAQTVVLLWAAFALRVWNLGKASLWVDEIITDEWVKLPVGRVIALALGDVVHMPLYFVTLGFLPTHNETLLRLPSVFAGFLSIPALMWIVLHLYRSPRLAVLCGALLAFNPYHIWLSRMARPYAFLALLSLVTSGLFLLLLDGRRSRTTWAVFVVASAVTYATHFFGLWLPVVQGLLLVTFVPRDWRFFRTWCGTQLVAGIPILIVLSGLLWVYWESGGTAFEMHVSWIPRPHLSDPITTLWNMTLGYDGRRVAWWMLPGLVASSAGLLFGFVASLRFRGQDRRSSAYWLLLIVTPLVLVFAISFIHPLYIDRYFVVFLPATLLVMVTGWRQLSVAGARGSFALLFIVTTLTGAAVAVSDMYSGDDERAAWRGAAAFMNLGFVPGDVVLANSIPPVEHYFALAGGALARAPLFGEEDRDRDVQAVAALPTVPGTRVWAICANAHTDAHRQGAVPFEPFAQGGTWMADWLIEHQGWVVERRDFNGVSVFLIIVP